TICYRDWSSDVCSSDLEHGIFQSLQAHLYQYAFQKPSNTYYPRRRREYFPIKAPGLRLHERCWIFPRWRTSNPRPPQQAYRKSSTHVEFSESWDSQILKIVECSNPGFLRPGQVSLRQAPEMVSAG